MDPARDNSYPKAFARLKLGDKGNLWIVDSCPVCGQSHVHGAGTRSDDPTRFLGQRAANCASRGENVAVTYVLVENVNG